VDRWRDSSASRSESLTRPTLRQNGLMVIICLAGMLGMADRQVLGVLLEAIKRDLHVSDTQMGMLSGMAFALFYVVAGIPLSRLADRGNRVRLLSACIATWSIATIACGMVQSFFQLVLARIMVGGGETGAGPATQSLIADLYPPERRSSIFGVQVAATSVGIALGMFLSGFLASYFSWRMVFVIMGAPGIVLVGVLALTTREPPREVQEDTYPPLGVALVVLFGSPVLRPVLMIGATTAFAGYSLFAWAPTFYLRVHGLTVLETGIWTGLSIATGLFIGAISSGVVADRFARGDHARCMMVGGFGSVAALPFGAIFLTASSPAVSLIALLGMNIFMTFWLPPAYTVMLGNTPSRMRGLVAALMLMCQSLIGAGLGPFVVGYVSDLLTPFQASHAIRSAMAIGLSTLILAAGLCFTTARIITRRDRQMHALDAAENPAISPLSL
jgi:MFS family permease